MNLSQDDRDSPDGANLATCAVCLLRSRPATSETLRHRASCHTQSEESFIVSTFGELDERSGRSLLEALGLQRLKSYVFLPWANQKHAKRWK